MPGENLNFRWALQPIVDLLNPQSANAEALLRVQDNNGRAVRPDVVVINAEHDGQILALDQWMSLSVLGWIERHSPLIPSLGFLSVNLSGNTLSNEKSIQLIIEDLKGLPLAIRQKACYEITETAKIASLESAYNSILEIQNLGAMVALDDYGSGYANAELLHSLPFDIVKISGEVAKNMSVDERVWMQLKGDVEMIHERGAECVIEHIESTLDLSLATALGARFLQGFALGKPMEAPEFLRHIQRLRSID